jgi:hypothetical protein
LPHGGAVDVEDVMHVGALVAVALPVDAKAPTTETIETWDAAVERQAKRDFGQHPRRYRLA